MSVYRNAPMGETMHAHVHFSKIESGEIIRINPTYCIRRYIASVVVAQQTLHYYLQVINNPDGWRHRLLPAGSNRRPPDLFTRTYAHARRR